MNVFLTHRNATNDNYFPEIIAAGKLRTSPTKPPFNHSVIPISMLKITNPIAKRLKNDAVIAFPLPSISRKNIGMSETIPKIVPAIAPLRMLDIGIYFFSS